MKSLSARSNIPKTDGNASGERNPVQRISRPSSSKARRLQHLEPFEWKTVDDLHFMEVKSTGSRNSVP